MLRPTSLLIISLFLATAVAVSQTPPVDPAKDHFDRGVEFLRAKKFEEALGAFQAAAKIEPKSAATQANVGAALLGLKRFEEASAALRNAIKLAPDDGSFQTALCGALVGEKKYNEAVKACEEGVRLDPESASAHAALVHAMRLADRPDAELLRFVSTALVRFGENEQVLRIAAEFHSSIRNRALAVELWERLTRLRPDHAYYLGRFAEACVDAEREAEAIAAARRTLEIEPSNPFAHYAMGRIFLELGQHGDASRAFTVARSRKDVLQYAEFYFAVSESKAGRTQSAIEAFRTAVRDDPDDYNFQLALGDELTNDSRYEEAVGPLRRAVSLAPTFEAKVSLGLALFESAQFAEGIRVLEEAERMKPGHETVAMFLSVARVRRDHIPRIDEMKRHVEENPKDIATRVGLIELLAFARRVGEVEPYVQQFLALKPTEVRLYQKVAVAYMTAGQTDKALEIYRKSFEVREDAGTYLGLAAIYSRRGQADEASAAYAKMIALRPDAAQTMTLYANHLRDNGKRREALEMYRRSLAIRPTFGPALASAAILSAKLAEMDAARTYLATLKTVDPEVAARVEGVLTLLRYLN